MRKEVVICDWCGNEIKNKEFHFKIATERFPDFGGMRQDFEKFDFCEVCASDFVKNLKKWMMEKNK